MTHRSGRRGASLLIALATGALLAGVGTTVGGGSLPAGLDSVPGASAPAPPVSSPLLTPTTTPIPVVAPTGEALALPAPVPAVPRPTTTRPTTRATTTPAPATPTPTTPDPPPAAAGPAAQVVDLTNRQRTANGCGALRVDARITAAAQQHSDDMSAGDYFSHDSRDGRSFDDRIRAEGYPSPGAENIAMGQRTAAEVVTAWMNSPGHRRNIVDCSLTTIGIGYTTAGNYWTQDFGR